MSMGETWMRYGLIPLLTVLGPGSAGSATAAEAGTPEEEVVLEASQIDARTVPAGARVVVVHGRGERHRVSGEWARLDTSAGWVQAVDVSALVLARERDLRQQRIPLDRIQRLVMEGPPSGGTAIDSMGAARKAEVESAVRPLQGPEDDREPRVFEKLAAGAIGGVVWGFTGVLAGAAWASTEDCAQENTLCGLGPVVGAVILGTAGYTVGAAVGVSRVDPHDQFIPVLGGSAAGLIAGLYLTSAAGILWPTLFAAPIVTATVVSEWTRAPPEDARLSFGLSPTPGRGFSAAATLAF